MEFNRRLNIVNEESQTHSAGVHRGRTMRMRTGYGPHACARSDRVVRCRFADFGPLACASSDSAVAAKSPACQAILLSMSGLSITRHRPASPSRRLTAS